MAKANVDPAELRRFSNELKRFNTDLEGLLAGLHGRLRGLEASWRDQEQRKFTEAFETTIKAIGTFLGTSHEHVVHLNKKASAVEEYLRQR